MGGTGPLAILACLVVTGAFVGLLYIWRGNLPRNHPTTIRRRLFSATLASIVAWLPAYFWATRVHQSPTPVHKLLGLRLEGLPRAVLDSLLLVTTLFAGPLVYFLYCLPTPASRSYPQPRAPRRPLSPGAPDRQPPTSPPTAATSSCDEDDDSDGDAPEPGDGTGGRRVGGPARGGAVLAARAWLRALAAPNLLVVRDLVAAPISEEWVFRACMVPLLALEGISCSRVVLLTPLLFGAAHLHHVAELVRHQGFPLRTALLMVAFQMSYTTVFGWLATYLFLRTGQVAAPVAAHAFCNWAGFPPFADMAAHPRGSLLLITTVAGVAAFALLLPRLTAPERYGQDFYICM